MKPSINPRCPYCGVRHKATKSERCAELALTEAAHPVLRHRDGTTCIWDGHQWFVPLDAGGEGYDCTHAEHREIADRLAAGAATHDNAQRAAALRDAADAVADGRRNGIPDGYNSWPVSESFEGWLRARASVLDADPAPTEENR